jgi:hydroxymethylpyrimidine pyrophosphatase-like HAD family hydrolase
MKKLLCLIAFVSFTQTAVFAQEKTEQMVTANVNAYLNRIEKNITLTAEEKEKVFEIKSVHSKGYWKITEESKDAPEELAENKKELNKAFMGSLTEAFGRERALEIARASQVKK